MPADAYVIVEIDLQRIHANAQRIAEHTGVELWAVVKSDAYGLGASRIAETLADVVDGFCVFQLHEAVEGELWNRTHKPIITLGPPHSLDAAAYLAQHVRPAISTIEQARSLADADPILCVDTGMQRFACPPEQIDDALTAAPIREAFTHASRLDQAHRLTELMRGRNLKLHAAASNLLDDPTARLDAVRPGLALYRDAVRITAPLVEVHETRSPVGYSGFSAQRHGVILCGYARGLRRGPCLINGEKRQILEVGMQSAYVEISTRDCVGDSVVLYGESLELADIARAWNTSPHEVLCRLARAGMRIYR